MGGWNRHRATAVVGGCAVLLGVAAVARSAHPDAATANTAGASRATDGYVVNDSHFHLTNYIQQGIDIHEFLKIMGTKVGRSTLFGIPLQQQWAYGNTG